MLFAWRIVDNLLATDAGAVNLWRSARVVVYPPSTPTQAKFKAFTLGNGGPVPVPDAPITDANGVNYYATTYESGEAQIKPIPFGKYDITVTMPGFLPFLLKDYKMVKGNINKVDILLVPAA